MIFISNGNTFKKTVVETQQIKHNGVSITVDIIQVELFSSVKPQYGYMEIKRWMH